MRGVSIFTGGGRMWSIREILESHSIAVIGASRDPEKPGAQLLKVLRRIEYQGRVAGVNPQGGEVFETPLYRSVHEIPFPVDLAVLHIPPRLVPEALRECARKGVKGIVISAEGFAEVGPEGAKYQEDVREILRSTGMRGFGPNTLGLVNTENRLTTSYFATPRMMRPGHIGFAAQSGIFIGALLRYLSSFEGCQLSKGIGLGNKVDVDESDALSFLTEDEQTKIIGMYLEDVRDGGRFLKNLKMAVAQKPVLMIKGGRTREGGQATASHTASMAGEDAVFEGAMRQAGVLRMSGVDDFVQTLKGLLNMPLPHGPRLAFVTYSGAQAIMSIDAAMEYSLQVAPLSVTTREKISRVIATPSKTKNPIDLFPDMLNQGFEKTSMEILKALLENEEVDGIIWISFANRGPDIYRPMADFLLERRPKPIFFSLLGAKKDLDTCVSFLEGNGLPCYDFPEHAVRVFEHMWRYSKIRRRDNAVRRESA